MEKKIVVSSDTYAQLKEIAAEENQPLTEFVDEALHYFMWFITRNPSPESHIS